MQTNNESGASDPEEFTKLAASLRIGPGKRSALPVSVKFQRVSNIDQRFGKRGDKLKLIRHHPVDADIGGISGWHIPRSGCSQ